MNVPHHPDQLDEPAPTKQPMGTQTKIVIAVIVVLVIVMIILHLSGVAPH